MEIRVREEFLCGYFRKVSLFDDGCSNSNEERFDEDGEV